MAQLGNDDEISKMLNDAAADFLESQFDRQRLRLQYEGKCAYNNSFWSELAQQGWLALRLPETQGGSELGISHVATLSRVLGSHAIPDPFAACAVMPAAIFSSLDNPDEKLWEPIVDALVTGDSVVSVAWQEDAFNLGAKPTLTKAMASPDGSYSLTGEKQQVVAGDWADHFIVSALLEGKTALFLIPRNSSGIEIFNSLTSEGGSISRLTLQSVQLPAQSLLARGDSCTEALAAAIKEATIACTAQLVGLAERAFEITLEYLRTRVQFGKPIGSFQSLQHQAVDVSTQLALATAASNEALQLYSNDRHSGLAWEAISRAKARASDSALLAGRWGVQAHGAIGFAAEADIGCYLKSAIRLSAWLGNGAHHRMNLTPTFARTQNNHESCA